MFETVSRAVLDSHELAFQYKKLRGAEYEQRRIQPYHLGCVENQWYVFGFDLIRRQLRTFALPRMRRVRDTRAGFQRPSDFSITQHLSTSFDVFTGKARHCVAHPLRRLCGAPRQRAPVASLAEAEATQERRARMDRRARQPQGSRAMGLELGRPRRGASSRRSFGAPSAAPPRPSSGKAKHPPFPVAAGAEALE